MPQPPEGHFGAEEFAAATNVSRETLNRLQTYAAMLEEWNAQFNLVGRSTLPDLWRRHFWDSAQLLPHIPESAMSLVDLGSGAGFPGLVLAELLRDRGSFRTVLYEATGKKCRFLEAVVQRLSLKNVEICNMRIEQAVPEPFDVIVARAVAPLPLLLEYAQRLWSEGTAALILKGQTVEAELTEAHKSWKFAVQRFRSDSDPSGVILKLTELRHHGAKRVPGRR